MEAVRDTQEANTTTETLMPSLNMTTTMTLTLIAESIGNHAEESTVVVLQDRDHNTVTNQGNHIITENLEKPQDLACHQEDTEAHLAIEVNPI